MPKPPTSVRSIRLPGETWAKLAEYAEMADMTVNAYVAKAIESALRRPQTFATGAATSSGPLRRLREGEPVATAAHIVTVPLHKPKPFNPQPKRGKR